jgi:hypothetical protein
MVLLYAAYFDASGEAEGYAVLTIAGAVAPVKKWIRFETQWTDILHAEGVTEFHATDFASSQGEYVGWKGDKERRSNFLSRLIAVVKTNTNKLFSVSVELGCGQLHSLPSGALLLSLMLLPVSLLLINRYSGPSEKA